MALAAGLRAPLSTQLKKQRSAEKLDEYGGSWQSPLWYCDVEHTLRMATKLNEESPGCIPSGTITSPSRHKDGLLRSEELASASGGGMITSVNLVSGATSGQLIKAAAHRGL